MTDSIALIVPATAEVPLTEYSTRRGKKQYEISPLLLLTLLESEAPGIPWDIHFASRRITIAPVIGESKLIGVEVQRTNIRRNPSPLTFNDIWMLPEKLVTSNVEWDYEEVQDEEHDTLCADDSCHCTTIDDIRNPRINFTDLTNDLASQFGCSDGDELRRVAIQARMWQFFEANDGQMRLSDNCEATIEEGYYGQELGPTEMSPEWSRGLVDAVRFGLTLSDQALRPIASLLEQTVEIPLELPKLTYTPYSRKQILGEALARPLRDTNTWVSYGKDSITITPTSFSPGRPANIELSQGLQNWLQGKSDLFPTSIAVPLFIMQPHFVLGEINRLLKEGLETDPIEV